jgi:hypothetical protein
MSLILTGPKTALIAGTVMKCIEIYTKEAYTLPFNFTYDTGGVVDCTGWTIGVAAIWYTTKISYTNDGGTGDIEDINISSMVAVSPQPTLPVDLRAVYTSISTGVGYLYLPTTMSGTTVGTTPLLADTTTLFCIITMTLTRTDGLSGSPDVSREPIGVIIRYQ